MDADTKEKIAFLIAGWLLGIAASMISLIIKEFWDRRKIKRKTFTQLHLVLQDLLIQLELAPAWREAGGIDTVLGLLDIDESWRFKIPPSPPELAKDFDDVLKKVAEWETERGKGEITRQLKSLEDSLEILQQLHRGLSAQASNPDATISERGLSAYNTFLPKLKENVQGLLKSSSSMRLNWFARSKRKLRGAYRRKTPSNNSLKPTAS